MYETIDIHKFKELLGKERTTTNPSTNWDPAHFVRP